MLTTASCTALLTSSSGAISRNGIPEGPWGKSQLCPGPPAPSQGECPVPLQEGSASSEPPQHTGVQVMQNCRMLSKLQLPPGSLLNRRRAITFKKKKEKKATRDLLQKGNSNLQIKAVKRQSSASPSHLEAPISCRGAGRGQRFQRRRGRCSEPGGVTPALLSLLSLGPGWWHLSPLLLTPSPEGEGTGRRAPPLSAPPYLSWLSDWKRSPITLFPTTTAPANKR